MSALNARSHDPIEPTLDRKWLEATVDGASFVPILNVLSSITDNVRLCFGPEGITVETVDDSHTVAAAVDYTEIEYNATDLSTTVEVAVSTERLYKVSRSLNRHDGELSFRLDADETHIAVSKGSYMNHVDIFDPETIDEPDAPDTEEMDLNADAEIHTVDLKSIVGAVTGAETGAVVLEIDEGGVGTYYDHPDEDGPNPFVECETGGESIASYGFDHLWNVVGSFRPTGTVRLRNRDEWPLVVETEYAQYTVAPSLNVDLGGDA